MKVCVKCGIEKPVEMFGNKNKSACKPCVLARRRELHENNKDRENARCRAYYESNKELILKQKKQYQQENFTSVSAAKKKWNAKNSERVAELRKSRRLKNIERETYMQRIYREENRRKILAYAREYAKKNQAQRTATQNKRYAMKLRATPAWADYNAILLEYKLAEWCTQVTGEKYHVDHIVPLQSKLVCGLHCESNLQVIRQSENCKKSNVFWPEMP